MERKELIETIKKGCAAGLVPTPWGSPARFLNRRMLSRPPLLEVVVPELKLLLPKNCDYLIGIGNGGTEITRELARQTGNRSAILRKDREKHLVPPANCNRLTERQICLVDDSICGGNKIREALSLLAPFGLTITGILCVVLWDKSHQDFNGIKIQSLVTGNDLVSRPKK